MSTCTVSTTLTMLQAAGSAGMRPADIDRAFGQRCGASGGLLAALLRRGAIVRVVSTKRDVRYYVAGLQPAGADTRTTTRDLPTLAGPGTKRIAADAPVIVPPGLQVTICPSGRDTRYTPDPAIAGHGQITRDWIDRRLAEAQGAAA
jgi:hypothetical protein